MMSSNEPIECLICHRVFNDPKKFNRHLLDKNQPLSKVEYEKRFNVILPHNVSSWNNGLTKDTNPKLAHIGKNISKALKEGFANGSIKNWTEGKTKEIDERIKQTSDKLKGHKIFIDPHILGDINKKRLEGKTWEELYGEEKASEIREQVMGENNVRWVSLETRTCACGCNETFEVKKTDPQEFIWTHNTRGVNNPNWKGGLDKQFYLGFTRKLKKQVKERDGNKCALCSATSKKLDVHHIDYNKKHSVSENLITLCPKCHSKTNFNREYWQEFFKPIMEKIYGSGI